MDAGSLHARTSKDLVNAYEKKNGFTEHQPIKSLIDGYNRSLLKGRTEEDGMNIPRKRDRSPGLNPVIESSAQRHKSIGESVKLPRERIK